jgi:hypothetical protein
MRTSSFSESKKRRVQTFYTHSYFSSQNIVFVALKISSTMKKITRKSSGDHRAQRRKEEKALARGTGRHATASTQPSCKASRT